MSQQFPSPSVADFIAKVKDPGSIDLVSQATALQSITSTPTTNTKPGVPPPPPMFKEQKS